MSTKKQTRERIIKAMKDWVGEVWDNKYKILITLVLYFIAVAFQKFVYSYLKNAKVQEIPDLILDHLPLMDFSFFYVWVFMFVIYATWVYAIANPKKFHYLIGLQVLLIFVRALSIPLTHLQDPSDMIRVKFPSVTDFGQGANDLFFSGHVAVPFLCFLSFDNKKLKYLMLFISIILGFTVLAMHVHYSIDVFAAFFITYGIYKIGNSIFDNISRLESKRMIFKENKLKKLKRISSKKERWTSLS
jgi:membrane-associated phospholipid phosphatase